jgi:hypothetical protein
MNEAASSGFRIHTYRNDRGWVSTAFGFRDYDTEEISAHWTGPPKYLAIIPA